LLVLLEMGSCFIAQAGLNHGHPTLSLSHREDCRLSHRHLAIDPGFEHMSFQLLLPFTNVRAGIETRLHLGKASGNQCARRAGS
jgi:hypothetical protein